MMDVTYLVIYIPIVAWDPESMTENPVDTRPTYACLN